MTTKFDLLKKAVDSSAILSTTISLQPANPGDPVSPPTYKGKNDKDPSPQYLTESRLMDKDGSLESVPCVILDTEFSQANRQEAALLRLYKAGSLDIPVMFVEYDPSSFPEELRSHAPNARTYVLEMSHRIADPHIGQGQMKDGEKKGKGKSKGKSNDFSKSPLGKVLLGTKPSDVTALFQHSLESLLYGFWNSREKSVSASKFQRAISSIVVGWDVVEGTGYSGGSVDVWGITNCVKAFSSSDSLCTLTKEKDSKGYDSLSTVGYTNIPPLAAKDLRRQFACRKITLTSTINLSYLRTLHFEKADLEGRTVLAALGMVALAAQHQYGYSFRSGCLLFSQDPSISFEILGSDQTLHGQKFSVTLDEALDIYNQAVSEARKAGIAWKKGFEMALDMGETQRGLIEASIYDTMKFKVNKDARGGASDDTAEA